MSRYVTVVYAIEGDEAFKPLAQMIEKQMSDFDKDNRPPFGVCAFSTCDELKRLEMIDDAIQGENSKAAQAEVERILSLPDLPETVQKSVFLA